MSVIDDYIKKCPKDHQEKLYEMRDIIKEIVPEETNEKISWGMPTFYLYTNLVHFADQKNHIGFHPGAIISEFEDELVNYKTSKGTIQFQYNEPLPKELIQKITKYAVQRNLTNAKEKDLISDNLC